MSRVLLKRVATVLTRNRRRKPVTKAQRVRRYVMNSLVLCYALVVFFPGGLFAYSFHSGQFHVHSDEPLAPEIRAVIKDAESRLSRSPLFDGDLQFHVYIANSAWRRYLIAPTTAKAFGGTNALTRNTVLNRADVTAKTIQSDRPENNTRPLSAVIVHECTHRLIHHHFGIIAAWRFPKWKKEGYCEYLAGSPSFDRRRGLAMIARGESSEDASFRYFQYFVLVQYALDDQRFSVEGLFRRDIDRDVLLESAAAKIRSP